ncbi:MAG: adenylyltransferase/cytidyltransferase family protein [bacterium]|nr:adenylyltransferase/cytidyltransferase family protein [bacterium]
MIIRDINDLKQLGDTLRQQGKIIVRTNGCFDLLHPGHLKTFEEAKKLGDILIVGLNGDKSPYRTSKPGRPIHDISFRSKMLDALADVDYTFVYEEETPILPITALLPDVLLKGGDYKVESIVGYDIVTANGGQVVTVPLEGDYSTTNIIHKILATYETHDK